MPIIDKHTNYTLLYLWAEIVQADLLWVFARAHPVLLFLSCQSSIMVGKREPE